MYRTTEISKLRKGKIDHLPLTVWSLLNDKTWLAGGALQTLVDKEAKIFDYDIFFGEKEEVINVRRSLPVQGYALIFECPKGELYTYKHPSFGTKIQLITKFFYPNMESVIDSFDIKAGMFITNGRELVWTKDAVKGVKDKILEIHRITYPISTLKRLVKYAKDKGYSIPRDTYYEYFHLATTQSWAEDDLVFYID